MKQFLLSLSVLTTQIASYLMFDSSTALVWENNISSNKSQIMTAISTNEERPLFNNQYCYLSNSEWITNQSVINSKYYSYDVSHANYLLTDGKWALSLFIVDNDGNLVYKNQAKIPAQDEVNVENTKDQMIFHRKIATINNPDLDNIRSQYLTNYFGGDGTNWSYVQQSTVEDTIDISQQPNANKIEHNTSLSEALGLYYIAKAVRDSDGTFKVDDAQPLAYYFISKSILHLSLNYALVNTILKLLVSNDVAYNYLSTIALIINNNSWFTINYIFDENNNIIEIYYHNYYH